MKLLLPPVVLVLLSIRSTDEVALRYAPEEGTVLERTFEAEADYHLADLSASVDGEPIDREGELPEDDSSFVERIVVTDTLGAIEDGRPTELVRVFDELSQQDETTIGEEQATSTLVSALEGRSVRFTWEDEDGSYEATAADENDLDEHVAGWLAEDMDLRLVLPDREVELGDEWKVDPKLYLAFMWPSGLLGFHVEGSDASGTDEFSRQTIERLEGSGTARLEEVRDEDGTRVAVIRVELAIETGSDSVLPEVEHEGEVVRPELSIEVEIERTIEGTILWDLDHGHALSAALECEASRLQTRSWTVSGEQEDGEEVEFDVEEALLYEGTIRYTATIERQ
jgi:hypothetical protein